MKDKNIKSIFDDVCSHLVIDRTLAQAIERYRLGFVSKNADHAEFFGGNLTGTSNVFFTEADREKWFETILKTDEDLLKPRCNEIIDPLYYHVASDVMNLSCVWLAHAFYRNGRLSEKQKKDAMISIFQVMQYKFITSRMYRHWKYPCDKAIAEATLAAMSNKYLIKAKGSWNAVLYDRAAEIADLKHGIHKDTIIKMDIDISKNGGSVAYLINDTQGRIRDMLKNIYGLFLDIHSQGLKISSSSAIINLDGTDELKDKVKAQSTYKRYLLSIIPDANSFIKQELLNIVNQSNPTMNPALLVDTLKWISDHYQTRNTVELDETIDLIMTHVLTYMSTHSEMMKNKNDISGLLSTMKGVYTAPRATDPDLLKIRKKVEKIIITATNNRTPAVVAAVRTGTLIYILLRTFTMKYYST
jgi:hypothetical protein